jgi:hypothetical protein
MGNRAVIAFKGNDLGIYLHWNGNKESVKAFVDTAKAFGVRNPCRDSYGISRMVQIIGNYFGGTLSIGIGKAKGLDDSDNGTYTIDADWNISNPRNDDAPIDRERYNNVLSYCIERNKPFFHAE